MSELNESVFKGTGIGSFVDDVRKAFEKNLRSLNGQGDSAKTVAGKVGDYLKEVLKTWVSGGATGVDGALQQLGSTLQSTTPYDSTNGTVSTKINLLNGAIKTDLSSNVSQFTYLKKILDAGKAAFISQLKKRNYESRYKAYENLSVTEAQTHAKIFLGCLPLIFNGLSYFYWKCSDEKGWNKLTLYSADLKDFLFGMDYHPRFLNGNKTGQNIVQTAMNVKFEDFSGGMSKAQAAARTRAGKENQAKQKLYSNTHPAPQPQNNPTYAEFLAGCSEKLNDKINTASSSLTELGSHSLSALHLLASCYFRCQQSKLSATSSRPPSTIREMLYFLAALPYSPNYDAFDTYISDHFKSLVNNSGVSEDAELMIVVADSSTNQEHNTLSAADLKYHLISTCSFSTAVLGMIQGPGASTSSEPWLYELYCNSAFNLTYSTGAALFKAIANYTYAVQFQLLFLYFMCSNDGNKCGWNNCTYGKDIKGSGTSSLKSHICPGFKCNDPFKCNHIKRGTNCSHNNYSQNDYCGKGSNPSALQAFLTGALPSFGLSSSSTPNHMSDHPQGALCHTPMGFQANHLRSIGNGAVVYLVLKPICGNFSSPLRQLSEKLGCLTNRTPRTLGEVFGFIWHLNGQVFKNERPTLKDLAKKLVTALGTPNASNVPRFLHKMLEVIGNGAASGGSSATGLSRSLEAMAPAIPFLYQLFMVEEKDFLASLLFDLTKHCHKWDGGQLKHQSHDSSGTSCSNPNDLWSMYQPLGQMPSSGRRDTQAACRNAQCGGYLSPLTHSDGSTYDPKQASSYLSWLLYLTDDFEIGLRYMLDDFKNIDCKTSGCGGKTKCFEHHPPGTHGTNAECTCDSVVYCGGVLPLLYRYGFKFYSPYSLSGDIGGIKTKRNCNAFHSQLQSVVNGDPLTNLLNTIDNFLYAIRWEFFSKLSGFWTIYICLILYTFFFLLDTLHLRSHLKLTASHVVPPLALLTSGTPLPVTKLTYIGQ
ncbi:variant erythrocyte surface antigen-1 family protein [Babesia caballi]|uniref:Variant erythrocyte surface antigen-1 family protein n=1 Tax=Babesia caballi TaxID=5871 RepID=A0AAV4LXR5_BABCB|nr:variant erythrocyte surface antigen-1 family protein [Babesia caballi]